MQYVESLKDEVVAVAMVVAQNKHDHSGESSGNHEAYCDTYHSKMKQSIPYIIMTQYSWHVHSESDFLQIRGSTANCSNSTTELLNKR